MISGARTTVAVDVITDDGGWAQLETGVDRRDTLSNYYSAEVLSTLIEGSSNFDRWGFPQGQGALVTAVYSANIFPDAIRAVLDGSLSVDGAVEETTELVEQELDLLG